MEPESPVRRTPWTEESPAPVPTAPTPAQILRFYFDIGSYLSQGFQQLETFEQWLVASEAQAPNLMAQHHRLMVLTQDMIRQLGPCLGAVQARKAGPADEDLSVA